MTYESTAEPIKIGYLTDFLLSDDYPKERRDDLTIPFGMVLGDALDRAPSTAPSKSSTGKSRVFQRERSKP
jgi:hypothetical protein